MKSIAETPRDIEYIAELLGVFNHEAETVISKADELITEDFDEVPSEIKNKICESVAFEYMRDYYAKEAAEQLLEQAYLNI